MSNQTQINEVNIPKRQGRRYFRWFGRLIALIIVVIAAGTIYESLSETSDRQAYPPSGVMVDVGGYHLHINCMGAGSPAVIIEAGWGAWSLEWSGIQQEVAKTTRVCTYDRAGMGYSEAGLLPRNAEQFARELHALLERANIEEPYVMVGHSLGGLPVRIFAHTYPTKVSGIVLIDSMSPRQMTQPHVEISPPTPPQSKGVSFPSLLARIGLVRLLGNQLIIQGLPSEIQSAYTAISVTPRSVQAWMDEGAGIQESLAQADAIKSLGDVPLIVVTGALDQQTGWDDMQAELLQLSSNSRQVIAGNSGHNIHIDQPEVVVSAIVDMVLQVR